MTIFSLLLAFAIAMAYAEFRAYFSDPKLIENEIAYLKDEIKRREMEKLAVEESFSDFRVEVATSMPRTSGRQDWLKGEKAYPLRRLASVVQVPDPLKLNESLATGLFERGREHFRAGHFDKSAQIFKNFLEKFSYSIHTPEVYFLLSESLFQTGNQEESVTAIHHMIELFPDNELTGYAMIRLGRILENQSRWDEAIDTYKTVLRSFPERDVASQAAKSLRSVEP